MKMIPAVSDNVAHPFLSVSHVASGCFFTSRIFGLNFIISLLLASVTKIPTTSAGCHEEY